MAGDHASASGGANGVQDLRGMAGNLDVPPDAMDAGVPVDQDVARSMPMNLRPYMVFSTRLP
jgi:hypothetical protein